MQLKDLVEIAAGASLVHIAPNELGLILDREELIRAEYKAIHMYACSARSRRQGVLTSEFCASNRKTRQSRERPLDIDFFSSDDMPQLVSSAHCRRRGMGTSRGTKTFQ